MRDDMVDCVHWWSSGHTGCRRRLWSGRSIGCGLDAWLFAYRRVIRALNESGLTTIAQQADDASVPGFGCDFGALDRRDDGDRSDALYD